MYEHYFGFREEPFSLTPDPAFVYLSSQHSIAYSLLEYGILKQAGFTVLTGDVGCGKTTLVRRLIDDIQSQVTLGLLDNTHPRLTNLMEWVAMAFGLNYQSKDPVGLYDSFVQFLRAEQAVRRRVILIIDEAQNLDAEGLEELRTLSNINAGPDPILQIILVGQPELKAKLARPELRQFSQRVAAHYALKPLSEAETSGYIRHRLSRAGGRPELFTDAACRLIHHQSGGVPRLINLLCATALVYAFAQEVREVDMSLVQAVLDDGAAGLNMGARPTHEVARQVDDPPRPASDKAMPANPIEGIKEMPPLEPQAHKLSAEDARQLFASTRKSKA